MKGAGTVSKVLMLLFGCLLSFFGTAQTATASISNTNEPAPVIQETAPATPAPAPKEPVQVIIAVDNAPPYRVIQGNQFSGLYIELFNAAAHQLGWQVRYMEAPFPRILYMMEKGQADIMLGPIETDERRDFMEFAVPAFPPERRIFYFKQPQNRITRYEDLQGKKIGVLRGGRYFATFDQDAALRKVSGHSYRNLMLMLDRGHIDVVIVPELLGAYTVKSLQAQLMMSPYAVAGESAYIAISRRSPVLQLSDQLQQAVTQLTERGYYQQLLERHALQPAAPPPTGPTPAQRAQSLGR